MIAVFSLIWKKYGYAKLEAEMDHVTSFFKPTSDSKQE